MARDLPRGQVTLVFTDIEGSRKLLHKLGAEKYAHALAEHRRRAAARARKPGRDLVLVDRAEAVESLQATDDGWSDLSEAFIRGPEQ